MSASGGSGVFTSFVVASGALPGGLTLSSAGLLSGTPTTAGSFSFTILATDSTEATGSRSYSIIVNPAITLSPATLPNGIVGSAYSQNITASGGTGSFTSFVVTTGALPAGLTLSSTGLLAGTPTTIGSFSFTIRATDTAGATGNRPYTMIVVNPPIALSPVTLPNGTVGNAYSQNIAASGGTGSFTSFVVTSGALPGGLTLSSAGLLSGTPTTAGTFSFTVTATDTAGATGNRPYTMTVANPAITLSPATLPDGSVGNAYSQNITASGGTGSFASFVITVGSLPAGLALSSAGLLSGTPTTAGTFSFTVTATDTAGATGNRTYSIVVNSTITLSPTSLPAGTVGNAYSQTISASGGSGTFNSFTVTSGSLPSGLSLSSAGVLSGVPTTDGASNFTITATDSAGATGSRAYTIVIGSAIVLSPASLPAGTVGNAYSQTISASGGSGTFNSFTVTSGSLPSGLSLSSAGVLSGTPTTQGTSSFTIRATDSTGAFGSRSYTIVVNPPITLSPTSLPAGAVGNPYIQKVIATGGTGTVTFRLTSGTLPTGISLYPAGDLTGVPTTDGASNFTITATDSTGATGSRSYTIVIGSSIVLSPASLPAGTVGNAYSQTISASGGSGTFNSFTVTSGSLPSGLSLSSAGVLSGTPTTQGTSSFTIRATDSTGAFGSRSYTIVVGQVILLTPTSLPAGTVGAAYPTTSVTATGGTGPFTFTVSGQLPNGLQLSSAGVLSGTPTVAGSFSFTITASNSAQGSGSQAYTIVVSATAAAIQPASDTRQVAGPNTPLPQPFVAVLVDPVTGAAKAGVAVTWVVLKGGGTLSNVVLVSGANGRVSANYTTGSGDVDNVVRVTATASGSNVDFTVVSQQAVDTEAKKVLGPLATISVTTPAIQLNNIRQRLDQMRFASSPAVTQALRVSVDGQAMPPLSALALAPASKNGKAPTGSGASADKPDPFERWGVFVNGDIDIGKQSTVGTQTGFKLNSKGITLGTDYRFEGNGVLGVALGLLKADTDLYQGQGTQDAKGYSFSLYGSYVPVPNAYIDGIVNVGHNSYDSQRVQSVGGFATSSTDGNQMALALNAGYAFNQGALTATPYGRIEYIDAKVDGFTENGTEALTVSESRVKATTLSLGGQFSYAISTTWGVLLPYARIEFQHVAQSNVQNVFIAGSTIPVAVLGQDKSFGNFAVGASAIFAKGFSAFFNYEQLFGKDNFSDQKYTLGVRVDF